MQVSSTIWCPKCGSDTADVHYASCPDHPTNIALRDRASKGGAAPVQNQQTETAHSVVKSDPKSEWFEGETTLEFNPDQIKKIYEYFIHNVLEIDGVSVVRCSHNVRGAKVTFRKTKNEMVPTGSSVQGD